MTVFPNRTKLAAEFRIRRIDRVADVKISAAPALTVAEALAIDCPTSNRTRLRTLVGAGTDDELETLLAEAEWAGDIVTLSPSTVLVIGGDR